MILVNTAPLDLRKLGARGSSGFGKADMTNADQNDATSSERGDFIAAREAGTLWGLFRERVRRSPDRIAYRDYDHAAGRWRDHSWASIGERVDRFRAAIAREGLNVGEHIAILLPNGIDWVCLDIAAQGSGLVPVGLYPYDSAANNAYVLGHSDARLALLDTHARWEALRVFSSEFPLLTRFWVRDGGAASQLIDPVVRKLADVITTESEPPLPHAGSPEDLATLIYTSGTTGRPKGVMLSHRALLWNAEASAAIIPPRPDDVFLSILPLTHAFERTAGYYLPMMGGCTVAFARSAQELRDDLVSVRPSILLAVPLLFQRMQAAIRANVADSFIKRNLLRLAASLGWRRFEATQGRRGLGTAGRLFWLLLDRCVAKPVRAAFGGRLRVAVSGGAPLDLSVARALLALGVPVVEGYGLTEAAPVVSANSIEDNLPGSVGRPLQGIEVKLSAEGELLVHSPSVMTGYWKDATETARKLDAKGWLSTGDVAAIEDGRLFIHGRLGETIVLSNGEKINPNVVEAAIANDPLFAQVMVVGDRRPYLIALIVLNAAAWDRFAAEHGLAREWPNEHAGKMAILARIAPRLSHLSRFAQVRAVHLMREPWTVESGRLTPTLKPKRDALLRLHANEIAALYAEP